MTTRSHRKQRTRGKKIYQDQTLIPWTHSKLQASSSLSLSLSFPNLGGEEDSFFLSFFFHHLESLCCVQYTIQYIVVGEEKRGEGRNFGRHFDVTLCSRTVLFPLKVGFTKSEIFNIKRLLSLPPLIKWHRTFLQTFFTHPNFCHYSPSIVKYSYLLDLYLYLYCSITDPPLKAKHNVGVTIQVVDPLRIQ